MKKIILIIIIILINPIKSTFSNEFVIIDSVFAGHYSSTEKNKTGPYFCFTYYNQASIKKGKACTFSQFGESRHAYVELYSFIRFLFTVKIPSRIYIRDNVWSDPKITSKFSSSELYAIDIPVM